MYASKSRRVLVVEDDALLAWELQDLLSGHGYEVVGPIGRLPILLHYLQQTLPDAAGDAAIDAALQDQHSVRLRVRPRPRDDPGVAPGPAAAQQADFSGGHSRCGRPAARNARDGAGQTCSDAAAVSRKESGRRPRPKRRHRRDVRNFEA